MKNTYKTLTAAALTATIFSLQDCNIVRPGQVGFRQQFGRLSEKPMGEGLKFVIPFTSRIVKINTRIQEYSATLPSLPSKEGMEISASATLLYHIKPEDAYNVYVKVGKDYEKRVVIPNFNALAREVCVKFYARDLISQKDSLEVQIERKLKPILTSFGITVDQIIIRDIDLPDEIVDAIKNKVTAEQSFQQDSIDIEKQRKEFAFDIEKQREQEDLNIENEKKEAEITLIQAEATKKANDSINSSLTDRILRLKAIDANKEMMQSQNTKLIITDGKSPISIRTDNAIGTQ
ncbi:MAG TPA: prohibitin family protein [Bacteroidia bacterium]|jgi:prohibitin 1|nr:prohibitin family protein [Bacteroidia bacterium]